MKVHHLDTSAAVFDEIATLRRTYDIRHNTGFAQGDLLCFKRQIQPNDGSAPVHTGDYVVLSVSSLDHYAGLHGGYVIMSLKPHYNPAALFSLRAGELRIVAPWVYLNLFLRDRLQAVQRWLFLHRPSTQLNPQTAGHVQD